MTVTITSLNLGSGVAGPVFINNSGEIAANVVFPGGTGTLWQNGTVVALPSIDPNYNTSSIKAIGDGGQAVGDGYIVGDSLATTIEVPVVWVNGQLEALPFLSGHPMGEADDINASGQIVGFCFDNISPQDHVATLWQNGKATALSSGFSYAAAINASGQIVGNDSFGTEFSAALWQNGKAINLGVLPGDASSWAVAINDSGEIVGYSEATYYQATAWINGKIIGLPFLPGGTNSQAFAINAEGLIVGTSNGPAGVSPLEQSHAVAWIGGSVIDLNGLLPANSAWLLTSATGVNDRGQIVGEGVFEGTDRAFLLDTNGSLTAALVTDTFSAQAAVTDWKSGQAAVSLRIADSAADIAASLDSLQALASAKYLAVITLTDGGSPTLSITSAQLTSDATALQSITSGFSLSVSVSNSSQVMAGIAGHATTLNFSGDAGQYEISSSENSVSVSNGGVTDVLSDVTALHFSDYTDIIAAAPGTNQVTSGNIAELYGAAFGRTPDAAGLAFYQAYLSSNPSTPLTTFAQWFLASSEYARNPEHNYAQSATGDDQFITDSYINLLHRAPEAGAVAYYQKVIDNLTQDLVPGTAAYKSAQMQGHALVLTYFSQSPEFLVDTQVTSLHPTDASHWLILV